MKTVSEKVLAAFRIVLGIPEDVPTATLVYNEFPGWDSVAHMALVAALEEQFDCMLEMDDILNMSDFEKTVEIMARYG